MHTLTSIFSRFLYHVSSLLFPTTCVSCKRVGEPLCDHCLAHAPFAVQQNNAFRSVFVYNSTVMHRALWSFKYKNNRSLARVFAQPMNDIILEDIGEESLFHSFDKPLLIPIPLHPHRKRQRGYNQSELLCKELSFINPDLFEVKCDVLYRNRHTESQARTASKRTRLKNVRGCFSVRNSANISGRYIILIDDIATTGATLAEATKVLKRAGAKSVTSYVVAH